MVLIEGNPLATRNRSPEKYVLATGEAAGERLLLLDKIFGPTTEKLLCSAGISPGMGVAEVGCGVGFTARWMSGVVGPAGSVTAVDSGSEQLKIAERNVAAVGQRNVHFCQSTAYDTGLRRNFFDLVFSRFVMCHLAEPARALSEMRSLLKPGGVLVCEDHDDGGIFTEPSTWAYRRLVEISQAVNRIHGFDSYIGLKLPQLLMSAGFPEPEVHVNQISLLRGDGKMFWELTLREAAPAILAAHASTTEELQSICAEMQAIAEDSSVLLMLARVTQVWARK